MNAVLCNYLRRYQIPILKSALALPKAGVQIRAWMGDYILHKIMDATAYLWPNLNYRVIYVIKWSADILHVMW